MEKGGPSRSYGGDAAGSQAALSTACHPPTSRAKAVKKIQAPTPAAVGSAAARAVHFQLPVSLWMVMRVVEQGQCIREKSITLIAVTQVQKTSLRQIDHKDDRHYDLVGGKP